jgi:membrane fusion protein (multidrug efflux system)
VVLVAIIVGLAWHLRRDVTAMREAAHPLPPAVGVQAAFDKGISRSFEFVGRIKAVNEVELRARVEGFLEKVLFTEGQTVTPGQLLYQIEKVQYQSEVDRVKADIAIDEAELINARLQYDRALVLSKQNFGTQALADTDKAKLENAKGKLEHDKAALLQAEANLSYTDIRSPIEGRIGRTTYTLGNLVNPASGVLATIVSIDPIYVQFPVSVKDLHAVREARAADGSMTGAVGTGAVLAKIEIRVRLSDGREYPHIGTWNFTDPRVDKQTDSLTIRATLPNPDGFLVDGEFVTVVIRERATEQRLCVPQAALQADQSGYYVLIVDKEHKVVQRRVKTGPNDGLDVIIQSGLAVGDLVILEGIQKVRPGQVVQETVLTRPAGG